MKVYQIKRIQTLPVTQAAAWDFFSSHANLAQITPDDMRFEVLGFTGGDKTYAGQIIRYKIFVLPFFPVHWTTEITHVEEPDFFVDVQRSGPFAMWHHQHRFKAVPDGVEMTDEVNYAIPLGFLGRIAHWAFVHRQLKRIFDYRFQTLSSLFPDQKHKTKTSA